MTKVFWEAGGIIHIGNLLKGDNNNWRILSQLTEPVHCRFEETNVLIQSRNTVLLPTKYKGILSRYCEPK